MPGGIRFLLDENMARAVAVGLRRRGVDALTVQDAGRGRLHDSDHLAFALAEERVLVTMDSDFLALSAAGTPHAGIVFGHPQSLSIGDWVHGLMLIFEILDPADMAERVEYI